MALQALVCPQCGANIKLDDDREFGFCEFCGTKIQVREVIEHHHVLDNTKQTDNRRVVADRAYSAGNYEEAEKYYTKILEESRDDLNALSRKGICSIYNMGVTNVAVKEFVTYVDAAIEEANKNVDQMVVFRNQLDGDLLQLMMHFISQYGAAMDVYPSVNACEDKVSIWRSVVNIIVAVVNRIFVEVNKENGLVTAINFFDKTVRKTLKYQRTIQQKDRNGNLVNVQQVVNYAVPADFMNIVSTQRRTFADMFNTLPSRQKITAELENNVLEAKNSVIEATEAIKNHKAANSKFKTGFAAIFNGKQKKDPEYAGFKARLDELTAELSQKRNILSECEKKLAMHKRTFM